MIRPFFLSATLEKCRNFLLDPASGYTLFTNRSILKLVLPLLVEQFLFLLVGTADTLMVAGLGEASISAVSLVDMFNGCMAGIFFALATGGAVVVSQSIGAEKRERARECAGQLLAVALIAGLFVSVTVGIFLKEIIRLLYGELAPDVYAATLCYFRITLVSLPMISVYGACAALFRSMNRTKETMYISLASNLINIIGNAILIYLCGMGVAGAAYATVLARAAAMFVILVMIMDKRQLLYVNFRNGFRLSWKLIRRILYIGVPGGVENGVFQFGRVLVLGLIASYGTREIAANAIANMVDYFGCLPGNVFSLAVVTVIGQSVGAGDEKQVRYYTGKMMKWSMTAHVFWNLLLFLFTPLILHCFRKIDPDTRTLAWYLILIHNGLGMILWPGSFVFPNILRSMNDVRFPMILSIASMFIVRLGASYLIAGWIGSGVFAVWIAMILDWIVRITGFVLRYRSNVWVRLSRLDGGRV